MTAKGRSDRARCDSNEADSAERVSSLVAAYREATAAHRQAGLDRLAAISDHDSRCRLAMEARREAYRRLYQAVPCSQCGAEPGSPCQGATWPSMHSARHVEALMAK